MHASNTDVIILQQVTLQTVTERTIKSLKLLLKPMQYLLGKKYNCREINKSKSIFIWIFSLKNYLVINFHFFNMLIITIHFWHLGHCTAFQIYVRMLSSYHFISYNIWYQNINLMQITWTFCGTSFIFLCLRLHYIYLLFSRTI